MSPEASSQKPWGLLTSLTRTRQRAGDRQGPPASGLLPPAFPMKGILCQGGAPQRQASGHSSDPSCQPGSMGSQNPAQSFGHWKETQETQTASPDRSAPMQCPCPMDQKEPLQKWLTPGTAGVHQATGQWGSHAFLSCHPAFGW